MTTIVVANMGTRPLAHFPPDIWGDKFITFTPQDDLKIEMYAKQIEPLKEEVRVMLMDDSIPLAKKMRLIDAVERLGVSYHFENEIKKQLDQIFEALSTNNFKIENDDDDDDDDDLYNTALQFRIFRQHGHKMPCDVFNKFTNGGGKFEETLKGDIKGMVNLYEASHLRIHGECILDEALVFTTKFLKSIMDSSKLAHHALKQPLHYSIQRMEIRHFISFCEEEDHQSQLYQPLLQFSKMDFNKLQLLYRRELSQILKWWNKLDLATKLPYARQRSVECHFWSIAMYFEPQYSLARILLCKAIILNSILDDTYDAYATFEELQLLTNAFERWDSNASEQLQDRMKIVYELVINTCDEFDKEMTQKGKPYAAQFVKHSLMDLIRSYFVEAKWLKEGYVPKFEEYMVNGRITSDTQLITISSLMGMEEIVGVKPFEQILQVPKAVRAAEVIGRLMNDIVSHQEEQARSAHIPSGVECYMKEFNMNRDEAVQELNKVIEDAWKDLNEELLMTKLNYPNYNDKDNDDDNLHLSKPVLNRPLNYARAVVVSYNTGDGYTHSAKFVKDYIISTYASPFSV